MSDKAVSLMRERDVHAITTLAVYETGSRRRLTDQRFLESPLVKDTMPPRFFQEIRAEASRTLNAEDGRPSNRKSQNDSMHADSEEKTAILAQR